MTSVIPPPHRSRRPNPLRSACFADLSVLNRKSSVGLFARLAAPAAIAGEIAAFFVVLSLLFAAYLWIIVLATIGFASISYALSHQTGVSFAQWRRSNHGHVGSPWPPLAGWVLLGSAAFLARLYGPSLAGSRAPSSGAATFPGAAGSVGTASSAAAQTTNLIAALIFAALFIGSGLVAGYLAYRTHNPDLVSLKAARGARADATTPLEVSLSSLRSLAGRRQELIDAVNGAETPRAQARREREALACELKSRARHLAAVGAGLSPEAFADAMHDAPRPT